MSENFLSPKEAAKIFNVTTRTLTNWSNEGRLQYTRTRGGHKRFAVSDVIPKIKGERTEGRRICYCRVSTYNQKDDLERQISFFRHNYPEYEIVRDTGSGLNFKRKGFNSILDAAIKGDVREIVVTHRDRLCRFGFELVERIVTTYSKGKIVVLNNEETTPQQELVNDLISIITVFSSRLYGLRSHNIKKQIRGAVEDSPDKTVSKQRRKREVEVDDGTV